MENLRTSESHGGWAYLNGSAAGLVCICVKLLRLFACVEEEILIYTKVSYCRFSDDPQNMHVSCADNKLFSGIFSHTPIDPIWLGQCLAAQHIQVPSVCFNLNCWFITLSDIVDTEGAHIIKALTTWGLLSIFLRRPVIFCRCFLDILAMLKFELWNLDIHRQTFGIEERVILSERSMMTCLTNRPCQDIELGLRF